MTLCFKKIVRGLLTHSKNWRYFYGYTVFPAKNKLCFLQFRYRGCEPQLSAEDLRGDEDFGGGK